ncbi:divalent-cation tolerance protein CutA [Solwaraspora sp. WMMD1047]|uniref:divalent-cation tolerance protein CutA n=1 Tax=Solwaraspora sp. WMMD1047 TaxID=3016102 RepID=UPI002417A27D|nr:divalent-cation tolerance protein CutA [Solwaraspora sp. WMMD1047]MDG4832378.1 divalent-cation tolerance protein CutA [Solwaraspora sp. WMMD1047]
MADFRELALQVATATADRDSAVHLAGQIVAARLAASAQVTGPVMSVAWHLGEMVTAEEWRVLLYTTKARYAELELALLDWHPWQNPQITATPIVAGSAGCLAWLDESVADR